MMIRILCGAVAVLSIAGCQTAGQPRLAYGRVDGLPIKSDPQRLAQAEAARAQCRAEALQVAAGSGPTTITQTVNVSVVPQQRTASDAFSEGFDQAYQQSAASYERRQLAGASFEGCMARRGYIRTR